MTIDTSVISLVSCKVITYGGAYSDPMINESGYSWYVFIAKTMYTLLSIYETTATGCELALQLTSQTMS